MVSTSLMVDTSSHPRTQLHRCVERSAYFYAALDERAKDVFRERLRARFAFIDQHLSTHEYLLGENYSIADIGLYAMTGWTPRVGFDIRVYANLVAHHARIARRDAVREVHRIEGPVPA